jgi:exosortase A-associated hydrolase 1
MTISEQCITFACAGETLVGVFALPQRETDICVLVIVGGPQYRAGSHRMFVDVARRLAEQGYAVLRFDLRGMGDSTGPQRGFDDVSDDIRSAIDAARQRFPNLRRFVLWGLCDGASAALLYLHRTAGDERVAGLCLLNPWVRCETSEARTRVKHYYFERLQQKEFWIKLFSGKVGSAAATGLARNMRIAMNRRSRATLTDSSDSPYQDRMAGGWARFAGRTLLILSGNDYTAKEFIDFTRDSRAWQRLLARSSVRRHDLRDADHTFSGEAQTAHVSRVVCDWMRSELVIPPH